MKNTIDKKQGFTLIELLMVIAIIGILAGILIPTVGAVRKQANIAASKSQLSNYVTAIQMFKGEYGYYPFVTSNADVSYDLSSKSTDFIKTLSGRDPSSNNAKVTFGGNRRQIGFHSFSESEFEWDDATDAASATQLSDRFNNTNLIIVIDGDGDGQITVPKTSGTGTKTLKQDVTAYVTKDAVLDAPDYYLYD